MKFKPKLTLLFSIFAILLVGGIHFGANDVSGTLFSLTGNTEVPGVDCWAKASTSFNGDEIAKSSFLADSPTFDFVTVNQDTDISGDVTHDGKIRCTFPIEDESNTTLPMIVGKGSIFKVSVYAYEKGVDDKQLVFTQTKTLSNDVELFWNTENTFVSFNIPLKDIIDGLKNGSYDATVETRIEGTPILGYKGLVSDNFSWQYPINENDITTWFDFPIDKTTGKIGGVLDNGIFEKPPVKNTENKSNDDITEFIECAKIMNTECLFNEKFNTIWMLLGVGVVGIMYMERSRQ